MVRIDSEEKLKLTNTESSSEVSCIIQSNSNIVYSKCNCFMLILGGPRNPMINYVKRTQKIWEIISTNNVCSLHTTRDFEKNAMSGVEAGAAPLFLQQYQQVFSKGSGFSVRAD